ncbi:MAG: NADH oxidase [Flavobacteriales bacterium]|nr:NADH oxidase [Flavobacteriales bacterium]|tara:strand:+ start:977 stop:1273 length:297 start_codon:yes stop_codon:yes gene_type:complete
MQEITISDFLNLSNNELQIIDIREKYEYDNGHIDALHIPMAEILQSTDKINNNKKVIIYCQTGRRAAAVVYMLKKKYNLKNIFNLIGGYTAYLDQTSK